MHALPRQLPPATGVRFLFQRRWMHNTQQRQLIDDSAPPERVKQNTRSNATGKAPFIVEPLVRDFEFRVLRQNRRVVVDETRRDEIQVARSYVASPLTVALPFLCTEP